MVTANPGGTANPAMVKMMKVGIRDLKASEVQARSDTRPLGDCITFVLGLKKAIAERSSIGFGLTASSDKVTLKFMLSRDLN